MRLNSIAANRHVYNGQPDGRPLRLLLNFDGERPLRLQVAGDGEGMNIDDGPLDDPFDMNEYGRVDSADLSNALFPMLCGVEVSGIYSLIWNDKRVGIMLMLDTAAGDSFHFWVDGDELHWGDDAALLGHDWLDGVVPELSGRVEL
jgi:hypothetical protein